MINITTGRNRICKDSLGGVNIVYLFNYASYARSLIVHSDLVLTSFPDTDIYPFELDSPVNFSNNMQENEGGKYYTENIELNFSEYNVYNEYQKLLKSDYRMIVKDNNGVFRLLGAYNGLIGDDLKFETGGAHTDFNGYKISFEGQEENPSLYINNLSDAGFTIIENNFLLLETGKFALTEMNELIRLE